MARYAVTVQLATMTPPTGNVLVASGAKTLNVQVDAVAYAALQQSLAGKYATWDGTHLTQGGSVIPISGGAVSNIALDTDGVPYFSAGASGVTLSTDTDGVPYFGAAS
jgi:hypothetical protein